MTRLGIDIGGTTTKVALLGSRNNILRSTGLVTQKNKHAFLRMLKGIISEYYRKDLKGIGIGLPGIIDCRNGRLINLPNLPLLSGVELRRELRAGRKQLYFDNDTKCIMRAEMKFGAARAFKNAVLMAIGTGIGGAMAIDRKIFYGSGSAGELGHMIVDKGKYLETLAAGRLVKKFSKQKFENISKYIGLALANIINILNPEAVILSGGLADNHLSEFLPQARKIMKEYVLDRRALGTKIVPGALGEYAGAIGAALLISSQGN